ncbi:MAG: hypothetical protein JST00_22065 [Deltaproteobacteria bacterium]|nr:hypothetical protein [Deltaproteobacteria bacterium]
MPLVRRTLALAVVALAAAAGGACLTTLPEATLCEGSRPIAHPYCAPALTAEPLPPASTSAPPVGGPGEPDGGAKNSGGPGGPAVACSVTSDTCLRAQREGCGCTAAAECVRATSTCFPPPDCPESVRASVSSPQCLEADVTFSSVTVANPRRGEPISGACACGCASCAATCDGKGPVLGGGEAMRIGVEALPNTGRIGFMARVRGVGIVTATLRGTTGQPLGPPFVITGPGSSFADLLPRGSSGLTYAWTSDAGRPVAIELAVGANAQLEIDCVVPFLVP